MNAIRSIAHTGWTTAWKATETIASCTAKAVQKVTHPIFAASSQLPLPAQAILGAITTLAGLGAFKVGNVTGNMPLLCMGGAVTYLGRSTVLNVLEKGRQSNTHWLDAIEAIKQRLNSSTADLTQIRSQILMELALLQSVPEISTCFTDLHEAQSSQSLVRALNEIANSIDSQSRTIKFAQKSFKGAVFSVAMYALLSPYQYQGNCS